MHNNMIINSTTRLIYLLFVQQNNHNNIYHIFHINIDKHLDQLQNYKKLQLNWQCLQNHAGHNRLNTTSTYFDHVVWCTIYHLLLKPKSLKRKTIDCILLEIYCIVSGSNLNQFRNHRKMEDEKKIITT